MARDVTDDIYYVTTGGKIPVRWTAPEVDSYVYVYILYIYVYAYSKFCSVKF